MPAAVVRAVTPGRAMWGWWWLPAVVIRAEPRAPRLRRRGTSLREFDMSMFSPPPMGTEEIAPDGTILVDKVCHKCSYNVRGLNVNGRCPECGTPVGISLYGGLLRYAEPEFVDKLRRGMNLTITGIVATIVGVVVSMVLSFAMGQEAAQVLATLLGFAAWVLIAVGAWYVTEPDPSGIGESEYGTSRQLIRVMLAVGALSECINAVQLLAPGSMHIALRVIVALAGIGGAVGLFAELSYFRKLALRIPDRIISDRAGFLMYAFGISNATMVVLATVLEVLFPALPPGGLARARSGVVALGCFAGIVGIVDLVFAVKYLLMLIKIRAAFTEQAGFARQIWAAVVGPKQQA